MEMDTMTKVSSLPTTMLSPPPPPPPPPLLPMHNGTGMYNNNERSQLLADIRKGMMLNKTPSLAKDSNHKELTPSDKLKKQTQDLLQAELSSTLKRRKPIVINEPPKYEYPTYEDSNGNGSSSSSSSSSSNNNNKINDSSHSTNVNFTTSKPLNMNAVLAVVTDLKLPDIQYDATSTSKSTRTATAAADKRKISHGKPNFIINHQKENKPIAGVHQSSSSPSPPSINSSKTPSPKIHTNGAAIGTTTSVQAKLQRPSFFTNNSIAVDKTIVKTTPMAMPTIDTNGVESHVEKCKSIFMIKSQKSHDETVKPIVKGPSSNLDSTVKFNNSSPSLNEQHQPMFKEILSKKNSIDESTTTTTNAIPFACVANKKALFEKPAPNGESNSPKMTGTTLRGAQTEKLYFNKLPSAPSSLPPLPVSSPPLTPSSSMSNGKFNTLNGHRTNGISERHQKPGITTTTISLNKNVSNGGGINVSTLDRHPSTFERTPSTKDSVDNYERNVHATATSKTTTTSTMKKTITTINKYETKQQFEQKTIVSFSKDLLNAPNNHPEQIRVKKTIINEQRSPSAAAAIDSPFHNIRFSIKTNGQVIPKAK